MRVQQVMEELHIELIVFHDQNGFRHATGRWSLLVESFVVHLISASIKTLRNT